MGRMWWLLLNAFTVSVINAAPRELSTDELITEPRPGEEYVNIQTSSQDKIDLAGNSFTTSHRIPELSKTNRSQDFHTSHKLPTELDRAGRSLTKSGLKPSEPEHYDAAESNQRVVFTISEGTTSEPPLERVVTRTSVKMSKSKKVQKSVIKLPHDGFIDIKADEGLIDERPYADEEEREIIKKKFLKTENTESTSEFSTPTRFNVPFEDEEEIISLDSAHLIIPNPVIATTQEPPITTFNYKNVYDKTRKTKGFVTNNVDSSEKVQDKYKYETIGSESIKTAESKSITSKKDTKQEKKEKFSSKEQEESGFYLLPVNKQQTKFKEDNYDFVDLEEKVLVPAGSSPSQSSRINIKKGPNGQEYEYEYVYYYYDDDDENHGGGNAPKEGKVVASTTEKVFNGHDGPSKEDQEQNSVQGTSADKKYQTTEPTKLTAKTKTKTQTEDVEEEVPAQNFVSKTSRGGSNRFSPSGRQTEPTNNEIYPSGRSQTRSRGRGSNASSVVEEEIPSIGEERLPANTRFPPRARSNNIPSTSPQPQETTARTRSREGTNQSRLRIPNLGLLDSSSFRTHASDASVEDDASLQDAELQRKANSRGQTTDKSYRQRSRPTTAAEVEVQDPPVITRRPAIRKPVEDRRPRPVIEQQQQHNEQIDERRVPTNIQERPLRIPQEETEARPRVPLEEDEASSRAPTEEKRIPQESLVEQSPQEEQGQRESNSESTEERLSQPQTTRESDAEEGIFETPKLEDISAKTASDQNGNFELKSTGVTTEDPSAVGLTSAMMEKVALDLYAILQQAQNENIRTNFIDGNSTDVTTDLGEGQTEFSTDEDGSTAEPSTTTTTTTTTTTPSTTTTTTTTNPPSTPGAGRGRYRGRVANGSKPRAKISTTTTTEAPEVTSPKTRGRFQPTHGARNAGLSFPRKPTKAPTKEFTPEEVPINEEVPRSQSEKTFGERPRNRFRASGRVTTNAPLTAASPVTPNGGAAAAVGNRVAAADRFHSRRRGGSRTSLPATQHQVAETPEEEERQETHQEATLEESTQSPPLKSTRPRIGGGVRPLRPGPRAPLLLPQRGHAVVASTTQPTAEHDQTEKEAVDTEAHAQLSNEELNEQATPGGDALTRLKSRPRLRIGGSSTQKLQTPQPPTQNRRKLVSSLLPKRKPNEEKQIEKVEVAEERIVPVEEIPVEEDSAPAVSESSSTTAEPEVKGLSGLLAGRRRNLNRRPGTIYSRAQPSEA